ncbi:MAG: Ig-like domain-containing protein [Kofleriaceae bacterium]|nr:Ig-like domain-containing protein [Kofleriaceae bacterium]
MVDFVGDLAPADGHPRSSYMVIDQLGLEAAPGVMEHAAPIIFYINKNGGTYSPGNDDARTNRSSIVSGPSTIAPWNVSASGWSTVKSCIVSMFSRWNVTITDVDPGNVPHYEIVIAGRPQDIGMQSGVGGVSPFTSNCSVIPNSIVYTFATVYGSAYQEICETAAQEIAHSFGLDHENYCKDPMTYQTGCGSKTFQDYNAPCGEYSNRACYCNGNTQNSVSMLNTRLGIVNAPPSISITQPSNGASVTQGFAIAATASDSNGSVARVELWIDGAQVASDTTAPYTFTAPTLSAGSHTVEARAVDNGDAMTATSITVSLQGTPTPPDAGVPDAGTSPTPDANPGTGPLDPDAGVQDPGAGGDDDPGNGNGNGGTDGYVAGGCAAQGGGAGATLIGLALIGLLRRRRS